MLAASSRLLLSLLNYSDVHVRLLVMGDFPIKTINAPLYLQYSNSSDCQPAEVD